MNITHRNIGRNKGKPRLWIEGAALVESGFTHGTQWVLVDHVMGFDIVRVSTSESKLDGRRVRRIAGTADRPIVDIAGSSLASLALFGEMPDRVALVLEPGHIAVRREADAAHLATIAAE